MSEDPYQITKGDIFGIMTIYKMGLVITSTTQVVAHTTTMK
jgi:hypothetical protein